MIAIRDQVYSSPGGIDLRFDFFRTRAEGNVPLVIFIHGGGWISGDKTHLRDEAIWLANQGFAAACIDYRLAPLHPYPAAIQDCQEFVLYARSHAEELRINPEHIAAMGSSAGGHLAAMMGLVETKVEDDTATGNPKVQVVIDLAGLTDLTNPQERHPAISWSFIDEFMAVPYAGNEERWQQASPINHVSKTDATFMIFHGDQDEVVLLDQSVALDKALREVGVPSELITLQGEGHGFSEAGWLKIRERYLPFLRAQFKIPTPV